jgi:hypothetical protein
VSQLLAVLKFNLLPFYYLSSMAQLADRGEARQYKFERGADSVVPWWVAPSGVTPFKKFEWHKVFEY